MSIFSQARSYLQEAISANFGDEHHIQTETGEMVVQGYVKRLEDETTTIYTFHTNAHLPVHSTLNYNNKDYELSLSGQTSAGVSNASKSQIMREYVMILVAARVQNGWSEYTDNR